MKKSRYTESQIIGVLKEVDAAVKVEEVCRQQGISSTTYYNIFISHFFKLAKTAENDALR